MVVLFCKVSVMLSQYSPNHYYPFSTLKRVSVNNLLTLISTLQRIPIPVPKGAKGPKGPKGPKGAKDAKVPKVTRYFGSKV